MLVTQDAAAVPSPEHGYAQASLTSALFSRSRRRGGGGRDAPPDRDRSIRDLARARLELMDPTTVAQIARLRRLAHSMTGTATAVDEALPEARKLLDEAGEPYRIVGGLAVVHHGYAA